MPSIKEFGGLDNQNSPSEYGLSRCEIADNVDFTRAKKIATRKGRIKVLDINIDAAAHIGNVLLVQSGGSLYKISSHTEIMELVTGLTVTNWLSAATVNGEIFYSNLVETGVIGVNGVRSLGLPAPMQPAYSQISGFMPSGEYLYSITTIRDDGFESGAQMAGGAYVTTGGIDLGVVSQDHRSKLYLSSANGEVLYLAGTFNAGSRVHYAGDTSEFSFALKRQFCDAPPAFQDACYYMGRMYYLHGNVLWASLPFNYELVDYSKDYIVLPSDGVFCKAVDDGIYIVMRDEVYFLAGSGPQDFVRRQAGSSGAIRGTAVQVDAAKIEKGRVGDAVLWASRLGMMAGFQGGSVANLTDGVFAFPEASNGSACLREQDGQKHFVVSLKDGDSRTCNARQITILANIKSLVGELACDFAKGELMQGVVDGLPSEVFGT